MHRDNINLGVSPQLYNPSRISEDNLDTSFKSIIHQKPAACTPVFWYLGSKSRPDSCLQPKAGFCGLSSLSAVQHLVNRLWRFCLRRLRTFFAKKVLRTPKNAKRIKKFFDLIDGNLLTSHQKSAACTVIFDTLRAKASLIVACNWRPAFAG